MIDLFLVSVDRNLFIQHSFSIDFCITTRTWVEHSKLSNQALDQTRKWEMFPDKPHPPISSDSFFNKGAAYLQVFMVTMVNIVHGISTR